MQKIKIIHILSHEPLANHLQFDDPLELNKLTPVEYVKIPGSEKPVFFFKADHHIVAGKELLKLTSDYDIECWRPYNSVINQVCSKTIEGITHRVFPAKLLLVRHFGKFLWSEDMYQYIKKMVDDKERFLLNIGVGHAWFHIWLMLKLAHIKNLFPLVCLHRSGGFRAFEFKNLPAWKKLYRFHYLLESYIDLYSLRYSDQYYSGSAIEAKYLARKKSINSTFFMEGIDFKDFNPVSDKTQIRIELGLPLDKKIMIVTGNFRSSDYGYHHLIKSFARIRENVNDLALVMIGGYKHEDLYEVGRNAGAIMVERKPKEILKKYLQACDFYGQPSFHFVFINFGGFGSATIEALACGLPVISNNIIHFPGTDIERAKIGLTHPTHDDLTKAMLFMKDNFQNYTECRALAQKYFDINDTRYVLLNKYKELISKYYSL